MLSRPSVEVLFVSGAPTTAIVGRQVAPILAAPLLRDLLTALSAGVFVAAVAGCFNDQGPPDESTTADATPPSRSDAQSS